jgi:hypothetical protein
MNDDAALRDKLRKIEALFAGAATAGEKAAAGAAAERIRAKLKEAEKREKPVEIRFSLPDPWSRQMFIALCRRYGLRPYRYPRMRRQSIIVRAPAMFLNTVLWPEFQEINAALGEYLAEVTDKVIREAVYKDTDDADEVPAPAKIGR